MRIFFDNCTSHVLAATLNGYVGHLGHDAVHIRDLPCGPHATDLEWMSFLNESGADWLVYTADLRIQKNRAERQAFRQAGLKGIVLAPGYQKHKLYQQASLLLWRWPDVEHTIRRFQPPFLFELPANRNGGLRSLPL